MDKIVQSNIVGIVFVPTGKLENFTRKGVKILIEQLGGKCRTCVSRNTDYVLVGKKPGKKYRKAIQLGVPIITEKEFLQML